MAAVSPGRSGAPRNPHRGVGPSAGPIPELGWSLAGHALLLAIMLFGGVVIPHSPPMVELGIKATLVDPETLRAPAQSEQARLAEERRREVLRRQAAEQQAQAESRQRAEREQAEIRQREEQQRQEQLAARERQQAEAQAREAEAARRQAEARAQAERERAEVERRAAEARRQQEAAEAERRAAEARRQRQAQADLARQLADEERRMAALDSGALAQYVALIRQRVERNWVRPPSARVGLECEVFVTQIPGGEVTGVRMGRCNGDDAVRRSIEAAVLRASPLPPPDDPSLFERNLRFVFKPEE